MTESKTFLDKKAYYFSRFSLQHKKSLHKLHEGRILGLQKTDGVWHHESKPWRNVSEHSLIAGVMAYQFGVLLQISQPQLDDIINHALTHDWSKRLEKEAAQTGKVTEDHEQKRITIDSPEKELQDEMKEKEGSGAIRVTGIDWRDFNSWGIEEKILRYIDSSIGETPNKQATIVPWSERIDVLAQTHPIINKEVGETLYGMPLYDKLKEITGIIERDLHGQILSLHPEFVTSYPAPGDLLQLISNQIKKEIENTLP